ncbi:hypothetical protein MLD38_018078 [Melastoma candidum]|uniref:Uncharacterized protein n=1 Tax=Melastoma candidum TaxID=119954 RepID=A0ACB9QS47_9MYRT|nr:hypothetical protein MLD38_018078 [Melastoma candidum]
MTFVLIVALLVIHLLSSSVGWGGLGIPFAVKLVDQEDGVNGGEREYKVVIRFVARANMHHLNEFLGGKRADAPQDALQILDIVLRELSVKRFSPIGRSFFLA